MSTTNAAVGSFPHATVTLAVKKTLAFVVTLVITCPVGQAVTIDFASGTSSSLPYSEKGFVFEGMESVRITTMYGTTTNALFVGHNYVYDSTLGRYREPHQPRPLPSLQISRESGGAFGLLGFEITQSGAGYSQIQSSAGGSLFVSGWVVPWDMKREVVNLAADLSWQDLTSLVITATAMSPSPSWFTWWLSPWEQVRGAYGAYYHSMTFGSSHRYSGGPGLWSGASNWVDDAPPEGDDVAISFVGPGGLAVNDLAPGTFGKVWSLDFSETAGAYTLSGSGEGDLLVGAGGIKNASAHVQTVANNLSFQNLATIDVGPAGMNFVGDVSLAGDVVVAGAGTTSMARLTGAGGLKQAGPGTLRLTSTTSFGHLFVAGSGTVAALASGTHTLTGLDVQGGTLEVGPATMLAVSGTMLINSPYDQLHVTLGLASARRQAAVSVDGPAALNGTLKISLEPGFTPQVGDRFGIISADELYGRFATFDAPVISGTSFLGLNYRRAYGDTKGNFAEVITLEAPRTVAGGHLTGKTADNLLLIVHGYKSKADTFMPLANTLASHGTEDVDVAVLDWSSFAGGAKLYQSAAENGVNIGEALGAWLASQGLSGYRNVQLMGHSAGTWLVNSLAEKIKEHSPLTAIQMTLFDSYVPGGVFKQGDYDLTKYDIGLSADFVEQYFHGARGSLPWTQELMPQAVNIDVTGQAPIVGMPLQSGHDFPYVWYGESAAQLGGRKFAGLGFALSFLVTGSLPSQIGNFAPGSSLVLGAYDPNSPETQSLMKASVVLQTPINLLDSTPVITGDVAVDAIGATLRTNSPAMLTMLADIDEPANGFCFDMAFQNDALGNLAVYLDGMLLAEWSNESFVGLTGSFDSGWIGTGDLAAGPHTLLFRLDNLTELQSTLRIEDVTFGTLVVTPVPEPSTGILALAGGAVALVLRRRVARRTGC